MYNFHNYTLKLWTEKRGINKTFLFFIQFWWNLLKLYLPMYTKILTSMYKLVYSKNMESKTIFQTDYHPWLLQHLFRMCLRKELLSLVAKGQDGHLWGFSPVWIRICAIILSFLFISLLQNGHLKSCWPSLMGSFCKKNKNSCRFFLEENCSMVHIYCF